MNEEPLFHGGCLCGSIRYAVRGPAAQTSVCHCADCRRGSGAPFVAWTFFPTGALEWIRGTPKTLDFAGRERSFCGDCGTPLVFFDPGIPGWFEVCTGSFDDPEPHVPADQCWVTDRVGWVTDLSALPAFPESSPLPEG